MDNPFISILKKNIPERSTYETERLFKAKYIQLVNRNEEVDEGRE